MMRSYVCRQCRLQLPRPLASPRLYQLQSTRTIVSFRKTPHAPPENIIFEENEDQGEQERRVERFGTRPGRPNPRQAAPVGRYSRFEQSVEVPGEQQDEQYSAQEQSQESDPVAKAGDTTIAVAQKISSLIDHRTAAAVKAAWELFDKSYTSPDVSSLTSPCFSDVNLLMGGKVFQRLSNAICSEYGKGNNEVPTPTQVLFRYEQLGIMPKNTWKQTIANITYQFLRTLAIQVKDQAQSSATKKSRSIEEILTELLSLWKLFFQRHGEQEGQSSLDSISAEWMNLPGPDVKFNSHKTLGARLQHFHPSYSTSPETQFSALVIFNYFFAETKHSLAIPDGLREQNKQFLEMLTAFIAGADITSAFTSLDADPRIKRDLSENFVRSIGTQMDQAPGHARKILGLHASATPEEKASHMQEFYLKRITRQVMAQSNAREVENLWDDAVKQYSSPRGKSRIPPALYNSFLMGFMTLYHPDHTVKVWNHMIANGVVPDVETWLAMLVGCQKAKDVSGLHAIWDRMMRTGIEPDERCWTTRANALMITRQVNESLAVLDEMGKRWLSGEQANNKPPIKGNRGQRLAPNPKTVNKFTKPAVGVINGAVDGIVNGMPTKGKVLSNPHKGMSHEKKVAYVHKILQWASNFDIKPDVRTYNALIKLYLDGDDYPTTFRLIRQMENEGIEGDVATHSMLLRAAFDNQKFDDFSPEEQGAHLINLFTELERGGTKPNAPVYSMAIDRLLKYYNNFQAVRVVLEHMMSRGSQPGPQIYTSLVTHYFQQEPPAIREIDTLVARILGPPAARTDRYLFDRIVEGYARNDEVASMMTLLTKMGAQGKRPSYQALIMVVEALLRAGDWDRARSIVRDVQEGDGIAKIGPMATHNVDRDSFYHRVRKLDPQLLESLAGEHLKTPVHGAGPREDHTARVVPDDDATHGQQQTRPHDQIPYQQSYDQSMHEQFPFEEALDEFSPHEQEQVLSQQGSSEQSLDNKTPETDDEFLNAEHAGYLSDELETPPQQWKMTGEQVAGKR